MPSKIPSLQESQDHVEQKQLEAKEAEERLHEMEREQKEKEENLQKLVDELHLTRQRTEEARQVVKLNKSRAEEAEQQLIQDECDTVKDFLTEHDLDNESPPDELPRRGNQQPVTVLAPIKLKGVDLPKFSSEDKTSYETWKAAFLSIVDIQNIPVSEKMLRLQSSLSGKALTIVKDLGYSEVAYTRAKAKLERRYGGERRLQVKH